jgi:hypothetical protein
MAAALRACLAFGILVLAVSVPSRSVHASVLLDSTRLDSLAATAPDGGLPDSTSRSDTLGTGSRIARIATAFGKTGPAKIGLLIPRAAGRDTARKPSVARALVGLLLVEGMLYGVSSLGYIDKYGATVLATNDGLSALVALGSPNQHAHNPALSSVTSALGFAGLTGYMISLERDEAPKGRVVLHHVIGLHAVALFAGIMDEIFKPRRPKSPPVAESFEPSAADSSGARRE